MGQDDCFHANAAATDAVPSFVYRAFERAGADSPPRLARVPSRLRANAMRASSVASPRSSGPAGQSSLLLAILACVAARVSCRCRRYAVRDGQADGRVVGRNVGRRGRCATIDRAVTELGDMDRHEVQPSSVVENSPAALEGRWWDVDPLQRLTLKARLGQAAVSAANRIVLGTTVRRVLREVVAGGTRVLEVGCFDGHDTEVIVRANPNAQVVGIDVAPAALAVARSRLGANADFAYADVQTVRFDEPFDRIVALAVLPFVDDVDAAARSLWENSSPGARIVVYPLGELSERDLRRIAILFAPLLIPAKLAADRTLTAYLQFVADKASWRRARQTPTLMAHADRTNREVEEALARYFELRTVHRNRGAIDIFTKNLRPALRLPSRLATQAPRRLPGADACIGRLVHAGRRNTQGGDRRFESSIAHSRIGIGAVASRDLRHAQDLLGPGGATRPRGSVGGLPD